MNKDLRLYNVVEKDGETRFIIVKGGAFFSLTYDNINQVEDVIKTMKKQARHETIKRMFDSIKRIWRK